MATHVISRRIQNIIQYVYDNKCPSKGKIIDFLRTKDFNVSARTLERDLERIRADFGLDISYNKHNDGYFINDERSVKVSSFFKFLEIVSVADIFSSSLKDRSKVLNFVSFDDSKSLRGIENLKPILLAINENKLIHFEHENYSKKTIKKYTITPVHLREYENRWYVIGVPINEAKTKTFGIDRINDIELGTFSNIKKEDYNKELEVFDNIIGLNHENNSTPYKIRLLVNELHINYLESLPLHNSQIIHPKDTNNQCFVDYFLFPNYEFKSQVLKMGKNAVVISPEKLKKEIKTLLTDTIERYN